MSSELQLGLLLVSVFGVVFVMILLLTPKGWDCIDDKGHLYDKWCAVNPRTQERKCSKCGWTEKTQIPGEY